MYVQEQSSTVSDWLSLGTILFIALYYREALIDSALRLAESLAGALPNKRGTAEQWIKEAKQATQGRGCRAIASGPTRCGCH